MDYIATVTLTPRSGYTLSGVPANYFVVIGADDASTNKAGSGIVTATFPRNGGTVTYSKIPLAAPVTGATPDRGDLYDLQQFKGTLVSWVPDPGLTFGANIEYTATVRLTAQPGWSFDGITNENFFTAGGTPGKITENDGNTVTIKIDFPMSGATPTDPSGGVTFIRVDNRTTLVSYSFTDAPVGYVEPPALSFIIVNRSDKDSGTVSISTGANFELSPATSNEITGGSESIIITVKPKVGLGVGTYTSAVSVTTANSGSRSFTVSFEVYETPYVVTGVSPTFTTNLLVKGEDFTGRFRDVISAIKSDAAGKSATIYFGDGGVLDIGSDYVDVTDTEEDPLKWGDPVVLRGKISSTIGGGDKGVVTVDGDVKVEIAAEVLLTSTDPLTKGVYIGNTDPEIEETSNQVTIRKDGRIWRENLGGIGILNIKGYLIIDGGKIEMTTGNAIENRWFENEGEVDIDEGTDIDYKTIVTIKAGSEISATTNITVQNTNEGEILIEGGTITATTGTAIQNNSNGKIVVKGGRITSNSSRTNLYSTIVLANNNGTGTGVGQFVKLDISGNSIIENTADNGSAIYNDTKGAIKISGGTVQALGSSGNAIYNLANGDITIEGGVVSATTGAAVRNEVSKTVGGNVVPSGKVTIKGTARVEANQGRAVYSLASVASIGTATHGEITVDEDAVVSSRNIERTQGTIHIDSNNVTPIKRRLSVKGGRVENTSTGNAVFNGDSYGGVYINGGTVSAISGVAVVNNTTGAVNVGEVVTDDDSGETATIGDGVVTVTTGRAIYNAATGPVNIRKGTVQATSATEGIAVSNAYYGLVTVSGGKVTTNNSVKTEGTILLEDKALNGGGEPNGRLLIQGGQVLNAGDNGNAVYNGGPGTVTITSISTFNPEADEEDEAVATYGYVSATGLNGNAVYNAGNGNIIIGSSASGGETADKIDPPIPDDPDVEVPDPIPNSTKVLTRTGAAVYNQSYGTVLIRGGKVYAETPSGVAVVAAAANTTGDETNLITVTQGLVTSINKSYNQGTIVLGNSGLADTQTDPRVLISGGRVENKGGGVAIFNNSIDLVEVAGGLVTSDNTVLLRGTQGTIVLSAVSPSETDNRLIISGGIVRNYAIGGTAVSNLSNGQVEITGGTVEATKESGYGVYVANEGKLLMSDTGTGLVRALASVGYGVYNMSTDSDAVVIESGTVSVTSGTAVFNGSKGKVTIGNSSNPLRTDPIVQAVSGNAVNNNADGNVTITGGTVRATGSDGIAVFNNSYGDQGSDGAIKIDADEAANLLISSANSASNKGTIYFAETRGFDKPTLFINKGTITVPAGGNIIYNASQGTINFDTDDAGELSVAKPTNGYIIYNTNEEAFLKFTGSAAAATKTKVAGTSPLYANIKGFDANHITP